MQTKCYKDYTLSILFKKLYHSDMIFLINMYNNAISDKACVWFANGLQNYKYIFLIFFVFLWNKF